MKTRNTAYRNPLMIFLKKLIALSYVAVATFAWGITDTTIDGQTTEVVEYEYYFGFSSVYVGYTTHGNTLIITNGGDLSNVFGYVGYSSNAHNNSAMVTAYSRWYNRESLQIGYGGDQNSLLIRDGGNASGSNINIGDQSHSSDNWVTVSGSGSRLGTGGGLKVGSHGFKNSLIITNEGTVYCGSALIGAETTAYSNTARVAGAGSLWDSSDTLTVGHNGNGNTLVITEGGCVKDNEGYIGYSGTASNNLVEISGAGSIWTNSARLRIGFNGSSNSLLLANGGQVDCSFAALGANDDADNNVAVVSDTGTVWAIGGGLNIGTSGCSNALTVVNGGKIHSDTGYLGVNSISIGNTALISGEGSKWITDYAMRVGRDGQANTLHISDGGCVENTLWATIGHNPQSSNNHAVVTGTGSVWQTGTSLEVGNEGSGNSLLISEGGRVESGTLGRIGDEINSSDNYAEVTGSGSTWTTIGWFNVGRFGNSNSLVIRDGGRVQNAGSWIGREVGADSNRAEVMGRDSRWESYQSLVVGRLGSNCSLDISDGGFVQSRNGMVGEQPGSSNNMVVVTGAGSIWECSNHLDIGGWISSGAGGTENSVTVSNGATISTSLLTIYPSNTFNLATGGRLEAGIINGDLVVDGVFALGNGMTNGSMSGELSVSPGGTVEVEIGGYGLGTEYDHLSIIGLTSLAGTLDVVFTNGFVPDFGVFDLFDYVGGVSGMYDSVNLPALPAGRTWNTDNLNTTGALMVLSDPMADINSNGIEDGWEMQYFGRPVAATNNPDSDVLNNYEEFIAGSNPTNGASFFCITNAQHSLPGFVIEWSPSIDNRLYGVNWSTNLTAGFYPLETDIEYPQNSCTDTVHSAADQCFYQVEVQLK